MVSIIGAVMIPNGVAAVRILLARRLAACLVLTADAVMRGEAIVLTLDAGLDTA